MDKSELLLKFFSDAVRSPIHTSCYIPIRITLFDCAISINHLSDFDWAIGDHLTYMIMERGEMRFNKETPHVVSLNRKLRKGTVVAILGRLSVNVVCK